MVEPPIAAFATPQGVAERAVIRLSGPALLSNAERWLPESLPLRGVRGATTTSLQWAPNCFVPVALLEFPGPASATGEDVLEIHLPADPPIAQRVLQTLLDRGVQAAQAGEFTRRAFRHGRLDLVQAEAVLELVTATHAVEAQAAAEVLQGALGTPLAEAVTALDQACAELEASLDFEEGDAQDVQSSELEPFLAAAQAALTQGQSVAKRNRIKDQGFRIVMRGAANCGKTTLFNRLSQSKGLISPAAGTTRDRLQAKWAPLPEATDWILCDSPGVGESAVDARDAAAQARELADSADLWWLMADSRSPEGEMPAPPGPAPCLVLWTCCDEIRGVSEEALLAAREWGPDLWVSGKEGTGLEELIQRTAEQVVLARRGQTARAEAGARHRLALQEANQHLAGAIAARREGAPLDWVAEELRHARQSLVALVGEFTPEDLLDQIFARFCLGK